MTRNRLKHGWVTGYPLLLGLVLPRVAGCQKASAPPSPEANPNPQHVVKITGRIPPSLQVEMAAIYEAENITGACKPRRLEVQIGWSRHRQGRRKPESNGSVCAWALRRDEIILSPWRRRLSYHGQLRPDSRDSQVQNVRFR